MNPALASVHYRPLTGPEELDLFCRLPYVLDHELADDFDGGRRRPEWTWVALDGDRLLARLAWWTSPGGDVPLQFDFFDVDDTLPRADRDEIGLRLFRAATAAVFPAGAKLPEYSRFVPPDWHDDPAAREVVESRTRVLESTGARLLVERLRLQWTPTSPLPESKGRLVFRPVADREDLLALMTPVMEGTLDTHGQADLASGLSRREAAERHYDEEFAGFKSPHEWWRIAELPDGGGPVGFVVPARNSYHPIIAYLGVLPAHRGNGHIDEILAEGTRVLAAEGVDRIRASTDLDNVPMAKSFARAGYINFERTLNLVWD
ncbi:GNAT family N-acetyltransferase [Streptomyces sp. NBC_00006]|uniref:GNAT family N-acetyltransferase n=1 Tax=unclassified Streptomyces TaxID=2593676 RepID=UPI002259CDFD|nr:MULTISPECIES: GNAT family N-acetyltransferase [unclassified Streptomyces]MCX5529322.1 GNAT family N-acetyltransferase [Streptomyces sp. NBC_00006]